MACETSLQPALVSWIPSTWLFCLQPFAINSLLSEARAQADLEQAVTGIHVADERPHHQLSQRQLRACTATLHTDSVEGTIRRLYSAVSAR